MKPFTTEEETMKKLIVVLVAALAATPAIAHETLAQCRARQAGCGAHGCDCGMTVKECRAARSEIRRCIEVGMSGGGMYCATLVNSCIKGEPVGRTSN